MKGQEEARMNHASLEKKLEVAIEGSREVEKEVREISRKLEVTCESWIKEKADMNERIRKLEKEKEEWIEGERKARRECEKKLLERVEKEMQKQEAKEKEAEEKRRGWEKKIEEKAGDKEVVAHNAVEAVAGEKVEVEETMVLKGAKGDLVIMKIRTWEEKGQTMTGKKNLGIRKVYIDDDYIKKERKIQREIRMKVKELARKDTRRKRDIRRCG
ncbi:beta-mannosyltransferase 1-like [Neodiprion lecontei]|uniref:Beta-mannosyltransferase 1-like n=1 Tax=Neodiprion lecontei TaxID=441921 RepID=A0A6J0BBP2_NEOLC|nr:beta-mannosyltransferase 1-like [Neodiprion lecontei]